MEGGCCLNPEEKISPGQAEEIDRICKDYRHLTDDAFVQEFLEEDGKNHKVKPTGNPDKQFL
jgi:hypothetical protein